MATNQILLDQALLIIGAPKCGTTALHDMLTKFRELSCSEPKEPDFFSDHYSNGFTTYLNCFDDLNPSKIPCEASPGYLASIEAPKRIKKHVKKPKFIVILRDPVDRAYSQYHYGVQRGVIQPYSSFEKFIFDDNNPSAVRTRELGNYGEQLKHWMSIFDPEDFLIFDQSTLRSAPSKVLNLISHHIGITPIEPSNIRKESTEKANSTVYVKNANLYRVLQLISRFFHLGSLVAPLRDVVRKRFFSTEKPDLSQDTKKKLKELYRQDQKLLATLPATELLGEWLDRG